MVAQIRRSCARVTKSLYLLSSFKCVLYFSFTHGAEPLHGFFGRGQVHSNRRAAAAATAGDARPRRDPAADHEARVFPALAPRGPRAALLFTRLWVVLARGNFERGVVVLRLVDPLGGGPLDPGQHGAARVQRLR